MKLIEVCHDFNLRKEKAVNRVLTLMNASVSHQINNPMCSLESTVMNLRRITSLFKVGVQEVDDIGLRERMSTLV